jgi:hypothetical protein
MKLSEAMRLGAMLWPQARGCLVFEHSSNGPLRLTVFRATCAWGAAMDAVGSDITDGCYDSELWPWAESTYAICPFCSRVGSVTDIIACLNDVGMWTRERIAAWIEKQENAMEQAQAKSLPIASPASEALTSAG